MMMRYRNGFYSSNKNSSGVDPEFYETDATPDQFTHWRAIAKGEQS